jgi:hypothetical protein
LIFSMVIFIITLSMIKTDSLWSVFSGNDARRVTLRAKFRTMKWINYLIVCRQLRWSPRDQDAAPTRRTTLPACHTNVLWGTMPVITTSAHADAHRTIFRINSKELSVRYYAETGILAKCR